MTTEEHQQKHIELHRALDELFADFIYHHPNEAGNFLSMPVKCLLEWSHQQTIEPTE